MKPNQAKSQQRTLDWNSFEEFVNEFRDESDRASVILGAAKLDLVMYQILREYLIAGPNSTDELLDGDGPLGTFSAKINLLFRLGLVDAQFTRALHMVRKIRNAFAHEVKGCSLDSGSHCDRIKELVAPMKHLPFFKDFRTHFFNEKVGASVDFRAGLAIMVGRLEALFENVTPLSNSGAIEFVSPQWARDASGEKSAAPLTVKQVKDVQ